MMCRAKQFVPACGIVSPMPSITQAFVLGAGLGTRLRPLTDDLPKPLIPIFQKPLISFALDHLIDIGVESFIINTHKLPDSFQRFFWEKNDYEGYSIKLVNEPDRKSTRLNSSHSQISYAVFCLKKKKT